MKRLVGKVVEIRQTEHGRFAVIQVRDEMFPQMNIYDNLHLACDAVTAVGDEISAPIVLEGFAKRRAAS